MSPQAQPAAAHARRLMAALAFWLAAVLFVIDVSLLSGWLSAGSAAAQPPAPAATATPTPTPSSEPAALDVALDGGATVTFPQPPTQTQQIVEVAGDDVPLVLHSATTSDETTYNVGVIEYPSQVDVGDPAVNLIASASGAAGTAGGRLTDQRLVVYQDSPAVEFTIETDAATVAARNVLVDHRLYAVSVTYADERPAAAQPFLDSLVLPE